jgi:hypothetical protein
MALPNSTSVVSVSSILALTDSLLGIQTLNRSIPAISFKAVDVQYHGFFNLPNGIGQSFGPFLPVTSFGVVYVRNLGGQGSGNIIVQLTPTGGASVNVVNLDVGAMLLYVSPALSTVAVSGISPGISVCTVTAGATTSANMEVLLAG